MTKNKNKTCVSLHYDIDEQLRAYAEENRLSLSKAAEELISIGLKITKDAKLSDQLAQTKNEILSAVYSCFALEALMIPSLHIKDRSSSADLIKELGLSEQAELFADLGELMVKTNGNFPAALADSAEARSHAYAHNFAFADNGFDNRDAFIDFYRANAEKFDRRVERRRRSREDG